LDLAFEDVKTAFEYYLEHYNNGRPIVIAGHSQGTLHAARLLKEYFDNKELGKQLVEAYLIGMPIPENAFETIKPSNAPAATGGFVTWNTFQTGYYPTYYDNGLNKAICTNPLTWKTDEEYASRKLNTGGIGLKFKFFKNAVDAQVKDGLLWINKPYVPGRIFIRTKIWHAADINLYWMNIRENVALRVTKFVNENNNDGK
jgi:pimeloyl-ACP methyl ester carboxylesterase